MSFSEQWVADARVLLNRFGFDAGRSNDRSARVLLALLDLKPGQDWSEAKNSLRGISEIMRFIADEYRFIYAVGSRESIRRQTLHQFADALFVEYNPDKPDRPVNSQDAAYRIHPDALVVIRAFGERRFNRLLDDYLARVPGQVATYAAARALNRIPVTLPDGTTFALSPGGQNVLIKQMVDDFCQYFTPGGQVLYVGDADTKWAVFERDVLADLGVTVDQHGKMPDLVIYMEDRNWLVLLEAATTHGPVDAKRHGELAHLFANSTAGLVYVSCFPSRAEMRRYLADIAWETEVWCADNATHLIHFNGDRYLGPH